MRRKWIAGLWKDASEGRTKRPTAGRMASGLDPSFDGSLWPIWPLHSPKGFAVSLCRCAREVRNGEQSAGGQKAESASRAHSFGLFTLGFVFFNHHIIQRNNDKLRSIRAFWLGFLVLSAERRKHRILIVGGCSR